jgi:biotin operon repressor
MTTADTLYIELAEQGAFGEEAALTGAGLAQALDITPPEVRALVNEARVAGKPIGSSRHGYFIIETSSELAATLSHLLGRADAITSAARGLVRGVR